MKIDYEVPLMKFRQVKYTEFTSLYGYQVYYKVQQQFRTTYVNGDGGTRKCVEEWRFLPEILSSDL